MDSKKKYSTLLEQMKNSQTNEQIINWSTNPNNLNFNNLNNKNPLNVNNINQMNINIINQFPNIQTKNNEELFNEMSKLSLSNNQNKKNSKDLALNYYFGESSINNNSNTKTNINSKNQIKQQSNFIKDPNEGMNNKNNSTKIFNNNKLQDQINMESQPYYPKYRIMNMLNNQNKYLNEINNNIYNHNNLSNSDILPGKFFVIKSIDEANIIRSISFKIWCSTIKGNQKLQKAYKESENNYPIYLFFSVNGSGKFMGLATMNSEVEYRVNFNYWSQSDKWKGFFFVNWKIIKDIPNRIFRNIINEYNDNKPVTSSRDTQEIHPVAGNKMLKIFKEYPLESSILDNISNNEKMYIFNNNNNINNTNINFPSNQNNNMIMLNNNNQINIKQKINNINNLNNNEQNILMNNNLEMMKNNNINNTENMTNNNLKFNEMNNLNFLDNINNMNQQQYLMMQQNQQQQIFTKKNDLNLFPNPINSAENSNNFLNLINDMGNNIINNYENNNYDNNKLINNSDNNLNNNNNYFNKEFNFPLSKEEINFDEFNNKLYINNRNNSNIEKEEENYNGSKLMNIIKREENNEIDT